MDFTSYYDKEVKEFFNDIEAEEDQIQSAQQIPEKADRSFNKKIRMIYSEPNLIENTSPLSEELQMSCIVDKKTDNLEESNAVNSDKVSQQ